MNKVKVTHWAPAIAAGRGDRPLSAPSAPKLGVCLQGGLPEGFPEWLGGCPARLAAPLASLGDRGLAGLRAAGMSEALLPSHQHGTAASRQPPAPPRPPASGRASYGRSGLLQTTSQVMSLATDPPTVWSQDRCAHSKVLTPGRGCSPARPCCSPRREPAEPRTRRSSPRRSFWNAPPLAEEQRQQGG